MQYNIDFVEFLEEGIESQQKYSEAAGIKGPKDYSEGDAGRYKAMVEMIGHIIEEAVETRMLIPRRTWKKEEYSFDSDEKGKKEFCAEVTDILLFIRALMAYSGISPEFFAESFYEKLKYNQVREDHKDVREVYSEAA